MQRAYRVVLGLVVVAALAAPREIPGAAPLPLGRGLPGSAAGDGAGEDVDVVSDLIVQGSRRVSVECVKQQLKTRVGKVYSAETLQADVRNLYATRRFGNVYADAQKDGHKVTVYVFLKDPVPIVQKVSFKGNVIFSDDDLDKVANIRKGMPLNPGPTRSLARPSASATVRRAGPLPAAKCSRGRTRMTRKSSSRFTKARAPRRPVFVSRATIPSAPRLSLVGSTPLTGLRPFVRSCLTTAPSP
jgi:hypothetical protein